MAQAKSSSWSRLTQKASASWQHYMDDMYEAYLKEMQSSNPELAALVKLETRRKQLLDAWLVPKFEDDDLEELQYEPLPWLDGPVVRLVQILPGSDWEPLEVVFDVSTLDVEYETLSYCWGDVSAKSPITCNGKRLYVTKNLKSALRDLRRPHSPRVLWIDAISINQEDLQEREEQVNIMGKIYRSGVRTVVWLGDGFVGDEKAFMMLRRMVETVGSKLTDGTLNINALLWQGDHTVVDEQIVLPTDDENAALWKMLRFPWFERVWVIQEVALAKKVLVTCGGQEMDWEDFFIGTISSFVVGYHVGGNGTSTVFLTLSKLNSARLGAAQDTDESPELELLKLLCSFRVCHATDPRDKVYALFGLTTTPIKELHLAPNYRTPTESLYIDLAKAILRTCDTLDILSVPCSSTKLSYSLPSWVPDWTETSTLEDSLFDDREDNGNDEFPTKPFNASGYSTVPVPIFEPKNRLVLRGYFLDRVTIFGESLPEAALEVDVFQEKTDNFLITGRGFRELYKYAYGWLGDVSNQLDTLVTWDNLVFGSDDCDLQTSYSLTHETREVAYMRTVCIDFMPAGQEFALEAFRAWRKERWAQRLLRKAKIDKAPAAHQFISSMSTMIPNKQQNQAFLGVLQETKLRRLFWTEKGYLGLGPKKLERDDQVWLIQGCRVPLVLRKTVRANEFELVGDCYIHGAMYGELFDEKTIEDGSTEIYTCVALIGSPVKLEDAAEAEPDAAEEAVLAVPAFDELDTAAASPSATGSLTSSVSPSASSSGSDAMVTFSIDGVWSLLAVTGVVAGLLIKLL
ncbi:HET-domain-containing protein [Rhizodiscina lignyota]|uniref:HET-domain-containing protein n=1 Tax=Rhizodiscina lignyota TaxID=1504668 RepID=A0A9P4M3K1_9PEZI|nr:HET-domain-containing protein [Rhizodiscina lignyota]